MPANLTTYRSSAIARYFLYMVIFGLIFTSVSAIDIDETLTDYAYTGGSGEINCQKTSSAAGYLGNIRCPQIEKLGVVTYIGFDIGTNVGNLDSGIYNTTYTIPGKDPKNMRVYINKGRNILGQIVSTQIIYYFDDWDATGVTGDVNIRTPLHLGNYDYYASVGDATTHKAILSTQYSTPAYLNVDSYQYTVSSADFWQNRLIVNDFYDCYKIQLIRSGYVSKIDILRDGNASFTDYGVADFVGDTSIIGFPDVSNIMVTNIHNKTYSFIVNGGGPGIDPDDGTAPVTIYIQNSQTGALLANARVAIHAAAGDPPTLVEVVNQTLSAGVGTFVLQKSGPANPYPRYYRVFATAPGYSQIIENHSFVVTGNYDVIVEMRPDAGGPANPDNCFVDVYVRDIYANPLASVTVQLGSQIRHTNAAGYVVFEVAKNATYPCSASKSGYVTIESPLTIGADDRYPVNIVLGATSLPTWTPTPGPGDPTGGATPRTPIEKASAGLDVILDNAENFGYLATMILLVYMTIWIVPKK